MRAGAHSLLCSILLSCQTLRASTPRIALFMKSMESSVGEFAWHYYCLVRHTRRHATALSAP